MLKFYKFLIFHSKVQRQKKEYLILSKIFFTSAFSKVLTERDIYDWN